MTEELEFTKEVTYIFENKDIPENDEYVAKVYHFVDNVENRRYWTSNQVDVSGNVDGEITALNTPDPLPYKGTGREHQTIKAHLIAQKMYERSDGYGYVIKMIFYLHDVSKYVYASFSNSYNEEIGWTRFNHLD